MKLVILHFHLNRGGVTSVILNHLRALETAGQGMIDDILLLHGGRAAGLPQTLPELPIRVIELPGLEYDSLRESPAEGLSEQLERCLQETGCCPGETILHAHNHSLGKNAGVLTAVSALAERGWRWLLQIHDFAEDFRPRNYRHMLKYAAGGDPGLLARRLYPQASQIHYAVLNGRDHSILSRAGVTEERLQTLPNPVFPFKNLPDQRSARATLQQVRGIDPAKKLFLYPVRGIRRKNLGEMLLWSVLGRNDCLCATTLRPQNPIERPSYEHWKSLSRELELPCEWELGMVPELTFGGNLAAADAILTTSLAEGFGMVFLEAWLAGKPLFGRDLPEITRDFKQLGVWYPDLSSSFLIPLDGLNLDTIRSTFLAGYQQTLQEFDAPIPGDRELEREFQNLVTQDSLDFAILDRSQQSEFIANAAGSPALVERLFALNPQCKLLLNEDLHQSGLIQTNRQTILSEFSLASTGERLNTIYRSLLQAGTGALSSLDRPHFVRDEFLKASRFHPARVNP